MTLGLIFDVFSNLWKPVAAPNTTPTTGTVAPPAIDPNAPNLLVNGGFESSKSLFGSKMISALTGWTSTKNNFEIWNSGHSGVTAKEGSTFVEMDAGRGTISQAVKTEAGKLYTLSFDFSGRSGYIASSKMDILWNNVVIATVDPKDTSWKTYMLSLEGTGGNDSIGFRAINGDTDTVGGLLDNVKLQKNIQINDSREANKDYLTIEPAGINEIKNDLDNGEFRDVSGRFNNLNNPEFGAAQEPFIRLTPAEYGTNGAPRGVVHGVQTLPNERDISNLISNQDENKDGVEEKTTSVHDTNLFLMSFGQFFDHGLDFLQRSTNPGDKYTIALKPGDKLYSFSDDGNARNDVTSITLTRGAEAIDPNTGLAYDVRSHVNKTSPFIDKNQTYGSSEAVTYYLRASKFDAQGNPVRDADGNIVKFSKLLTGPKDSQGYDELPTYKDILLNNGVKQSTIDAAIAANSFDVLMGDPNFVDYRNVIDPKSRQADGNPLLLDVSFDSNPAGPAFNINKLLGNYVAGDGRANENIHLTPIHSIFHREHNHWEGVLREKTGGAWSEEEYFQGAKSIVESEYQRIIFDEFIDALAGSLPGPIPHGFDGYHARVDAQISEEFAHAMYRVGHSMITEKIPFTAADGSVQQMSLVQAFLNPAKFDEIGTGALINGATRVAHERIDENLVNAVRNQLLGQASDLAAINIGRGREVGIQSLNDVRRALYEQGSQEADNGSDVTRALKGNPELKPYANWDEFASNLRDPSLVNLFKQVYATVDDVDLWIGGLAEKPRSSDEGQMGKTFTWIFWEQMDRIQDGDRFYYKGRFSDTETLGLIETQTFADIIMRNSGEEFLADKVFQLSQQVRMGLAEKARVFTSATETIVGNALDNDIKAGAGNDTVYGQAGNDIIRGGEGNDGLRGEDGNDTLYGDAGDDRLVGGDGNDTLYGGDSEDALNGNAGNDIIHGESGDDEVHGNEGDDQLFGASGNDTIKGGLGNDAIDAGDGNDIIETNGGNDQVKTGSGRDVILMSDDAGKVTISDFDINNDRIDMKVFDVTNYAELLAKLTITSTTAGAVLKIGASEILLKGVNSTSLTMNNFKFENDDQNLVINGRMDEKRIIVSGSQISQEDILANSSWAYAQNDKSVGWKNAGDTMVEYQRVGGNDVIELDADIRQDSIYQDIPTRAGEVYKLSLDTIQRGGTVASTNSIEVLWNGNWITTIEPGKAWATSVLEVIGTGGKDRLTFREQTGDNDGFGAYIDNVILASKDNQAEVYRLTGTAGDQVYKDITGVTEYIDGKGGNDTYSVATSSSGYEIIRDADGSTKVKLGSEVLAVLSNIEIIKFTDFAYKLENNAWMKTNVDGSPIIVDKTIYGTDGDDYLAGTADDDVISGGNGNDTFVQTGGNDTIKGGADYNQIDLLGSRIHYSFAQNADGSYTITDSRDGSVITGYDISGIWFTYDSAWYNPADLLQTPPTGGTGEIIGTDGDDYITGTSGDDIVRGGNGNDTYSKSSGNDTFHGGAGYNQIDLAGAKADFTFTKNADGSFAITDIRDGSVVTAYDLGGVWFTSDSVWSNPADLAVAATPGGTNTILGTAGDDFILGTAGDDVMKGGEGNDTFVGSKGNDAIDGEGGTYNQVDYAGTKQDYTFSKNADGSYTVSSAEFGQDVLSNIDGIWFQGSAEWHAIDQLAAQ